MQRTVLAHVVALHPTRLGAGELQREILLGRTDFAGYDALDRAVRGPVAVGLVRHDGDSVGHTRSALLRRAWLVAAA